MVSEQRLRRWIRAVRQGRRPPRALIDELRRLPFDEMGFARLDTHRRLRRGLPEIIFCDGKSPQQLRALVQRLASLHEVALLTRLDPSRVARLQQAVPQLRYHAAARIGYVLPRRRGAQKGCALVMTGGTSDLPIAEEAAVTLELLGSRTMRLYDVGVAGVHRLLSNWRVLQRARVLVVIAGMEGALASVAAGLVRCPVIAVPTSVGYGASFHGIGPLLTMLNSCVPGIGVVNIDNGFGAGYLAHLINQAPARR